MRNAAFWTEIPVKNYERAKAFYETVFGIKIDSVPFQRGKYGIFPLDMKELGAGVAIVEGEGYVPSDTGTLVYLDKGDADLNSPLSKIEGAGGLVLLPKTNNDGFGFIAQFTDSEGNKMGLHSFA